METAIKSKNYSQIQTSQAEPTVKIGNENFDEFFSAPGGLVLPSVILLTGSSGAGKTTMAKHIQKQLPGHKSSIYLRESPESQVNTQTIGIKIEHGNDYVCDQNSCPTFFDYMEELDRLKPTVVFVDSLQVIAKEDFADMNEDDAMYQIIKMLRVWADKNSAIVFLIGHVTKEDGFRGANTIMQMVDGHLEMIYNKKENYRTLSWGQKNRKGDATKKLYYEFVIENNLVVGFEFLTQKEFDFKDKKVKFDDYLLKTVVEFANNVNKKSPAYSSFKAEYTERVKKIDAKKSKMEIIVALAQIVNELTTKYEL
jgi:predicted ATP-dependent serine protease